jgi:hypothetical protein
MAWTSANVRAPALQVQGEPGSTVVKQAHEELKGEKPEQFKVFLLAIGAGCAVQRSTG